jgi:hypothetical protein
VKAICWLIAKIYGTEFLLEKLLLMHLFKKFTAYLKLKVHFHALKGQNLDLILQQINSVHTILLISLTSTFILSLHLRCLSLLSNLLSSDIPNKILEVFFIFPNLVTSSYHLIPLDFISIQIYGKQYKFRQFSLRNFRICPLLQATATAAAAASSFFFFFFFWHYNPWRTLASSKIVPLFLVL